MKVTQKEWRVLERVLTEFVNDQGLRKANSKRDLTEDQAVIGNLYSRFKLELTFPKGLKP